MPETRENSSSVGSVRGLRVLEVMECTIGGTRRHLVDVAEGLAARGAEVHLAVSTLRQADFRRDLELLAQRGCVVHELPMVRSISPATDYRHYRAICRLLEDVRPGIVHTHSSKAGVLGRTASLRTGIGRRLHTPHTFAFSFDAMFGALKRGLIYRVERRLAASTEAVIAVSPSEARRIAGSGVVAPERVRVVPNGIDPGPYDGVRAPGAGEFDLDPARPLAAVIGLLNRAKGQDLLLEALARARDESLQLLVVGHGELEAELRSLSARLGLEGRVRFCGYRDDVPAILAACDLLVLPSRWEGLPYVVLEAMASAKPVLATPVDGAVDLVADGESGWLASAVSADALAERLDSLPLDDASALAEAGVRGRERMLESWTRERMLDALCELYTGHA